MFCVFPGVLCLLHCHLTSTKLLKVRSVHELSCASSYRSVHELSCACSYRSVHELTFACSYNMRGKSYIPAGAAQFLADEREAMASV